jgi:ligand-binding SRPBCC domain-containing protein
MTDIISYQPPYGILGKLANAIIIKKKLKEIFDYRTVVIREIFNS